MKKTIQLDSPEETEAYAAAVGARLKGGECIELSSDLGGGKTTFTRGLLRGMGSDALVSSPTFTIGKQYPAGVLTVYHFDFYRLQEPGLVAEELQESLVDPFAVTVIEWATTVQDVLPKQRIIIEIMKTADNENQRSLTISIPSGLDYLAQGISI
jgi:tRNA threonylcarbamoyladenosine biosynthesis protein TsaE